MDSNSTRSRATVAREDFHTSPWLSSNELDAMVAALDALDAPESLSPAQELAARDVLTVEAWRTARARLDRAIEAVASKLSRPVNEWPALEREWRGALSELGYHHARLDASTVAALVTDWHSKRTPETRQRWKQLELVATNGGAR